MKPCSNGCNLEGRADASLQWYVSFVSILLQYIHMMSRVPLVSLARARTLSVDAVVMRGLVDV